MFSFSPLDKWQANILIHQTFFFFIYFVVILQLSHEYKNWRRRSVTFKMSAAHYGLNPTALQLPFWRTIRRETSFSLPCRKLISGWQRLWQQEELKRLQFKKFLVQKTWWQFGDRWDMSTCRGLGSTLLALASSQGHRQHPRSSRKAKAGSPAPAVDQRQLRARDEQRINDSGFFFFLCLFVK